MSMIDKVVEKFPEELRLPMFEALTVVKEESKELIAREEISKVWKAIERLSESQEKAEARLAGIELKIAELAEAQKKTEQRVNELAEAQKKTEQRVSELAEAQKKTEQRVNELAEAQKKTEQRLTVLEEKMAELAEAQKRTEENLNKLIGVVEDLKEQVGGHSHTIGHILEDKAILKLPKILKERYGIEIEGKLKRGYLENDKGEMEEINVFGFGKKDGKRLLILGEGKSRFSKNDLKDLQKKVLRFKKRYEVFPVIITYIFSSYKVEKDAKEKGLATFLSYELEE